MVNSFREFFLTKKIGPFHLKREYMMILKMNPPLLVSKIKMWNQEEEKGQKFQRILVLIFLLSWQKMSLKQIKKLWLLQMLLCGRKQLKVKLILFCKSHTWEVVDLPPGNKPIGYKWIFKKKLKVDGTIDKYKVRLVAKGYRQKEGLDYFDIYSPVSRITSIRMLIAIAAIKNLEIHQMDVKTVFLNGELEEEIYMEQPEGFIVKGQENKVCRLVKSLYGLKQAMKQWHEKFDHTMLTNGFKINECDECDKCVYVKSDDNSYAIVCLYVDDMLILG